MTDDGSLRSILAHGAVLVATLAFAWMLVHVGLWMDEPSQTHARAIMISVAATTGAMGGLAAARLRSRLTPWPSLLALAMAAAAYQAVTGVLWSLEAVRDLLQGTTASWFLAQTPWTVLLGFTAVVALAFLAANRVAARIRS